MRLISASSAGLSFVVGTTCSWWMTISVQASTDSPGTTYSRMKTFSMANEEPWSHFRFRKRIVSPPNWQLLRFLVNSAPIHASKGRLDLGGGSFLWLRFHKGGGFRSVGALGHVQQVVGRRIGGLGLGGLVGWGRGRLSHPGQGEKHPSHHNHGAKGNQEHHGRPKPQNGVLGGAGFHHSDQVVGDPLHQWLPQNSQSSVDHKRPPSRPPILEGLSSPIPTLLHLLLLLGT
jgi:hypothetical protein